MSVNTTQLGDLKTLISALALLISSFSLFFSWRSGRISAQALAINEGQEQRRKPKLGIYLARAYRRLAPHQQLFGFLISVTNPTDIDNSVASAELQITYLLENDVKAICRIQHSAALGSISVHDTQAANIFSVPIRIDAHQTVSGWLLFALDDKVIGNGTVDRHSLILEDTHGISADTGSIAVSEWTHENKKR